MKPTEFPPRIIVQFPDGVHPESRLTFGAQGKGNYLSREEHEALLRAARAEVWMEIGDQLSKGGFWTPQEAVRFCEKKAKLCREEE